MYDRLFKYAPFAISLLVNILCLQRKAATNILIHDIVTGIFFRLNIKLYGFQFPGLLLKIKFPNILGNLQQFFFCIGFSIKL